MIGQSGLVVLQPAEIMVNEAEPAPVTISPLVRTKHLAQDTKTTSNNLNHVEDTNVLVCLNGQLSLNVPKLAESEWDTPNKPEAVYSAQRATTAADASTESAKMAKDSSDTKDATQTSDAHSGDLGTPGLSV